MAEFVLNKTQRLTFDSSSPDGILLFREVSKVGRACGCWPACARPPVTAGGRPARMRRAPNAALSIQPHLGPPAPTACPPVSPPPHTPWQVIVTYGSRIVTLGPTPDPYGQVSAPCLLALSARPWQGAGRLRGAARPPAGKVSRPSAPDAAAAPDARCPSRPAPPARPPQKYKGIWVCLAILTRALGGNYVNFGVFELYGDPALKVGGWVGWGQGVGWSGKRV